MLSTHLTAVWIPFAKHLQLSFRDYVISPECFSMRAYRSVSACLCWAVSINNMFILTGDARVIDLRLKEKKNAVKKACIFFRREWRHPRDCMDASVWLTAPGVLHTTQPTCIHESVSARLERTHPDWHVYRCFPLHAFLGRTESLSGRCKNEQKNSPPARCHACCHVWFMKWEGAHDCHVFVHEARWDYCMF